MICIDNDVRFSSRRFDFWKTSVIFIKDICGFIFWNEDVELFDGMHGILIFDPLWLLLSQERIEKNKRREKDPG